MIWSEGRRDAQGKVEKWGCEISETRVILVSVWPLNVELTNYRCVPIVSSIPCFMTQVLLSSSNLLLPIHIVTANNQHIRIQQPSYLTPASESQMCFRLIGTLGHRITAPLKISLMGAGWGAAVAE